MSGVAHGAPSDAPPVDLPRHLRLTRRHAQHVAEAMIISPRRPSGLHSYAILRVAYLTLNLRQQGLHESRYSFDTVSIIWLHARLWQLFKMLHLETNLNSGHSRGQGSVANTATTEISRRSLGTSAGQSTVHGGLRGPCRRAADSPVDINSVYVLAIPGTSPTDPSEVRALVTAGPPAGRRRMRSQVDPDMGT